MECPLLKVQDVSKQYALDPAPALKVLNRVTLTVNAGDSVALTGPSGSGKSTLLNVIGGLDFPDSGTVTLKGRALAGLGEEELAGIRAREIGFVFQLHHLLPQCTVLENVLVPALAITSPVPSAVEIRAKALLERVGLKDRHHSMPAVLSGGERQRVAVVRALINQPALVLADEPTGALDHQAALALTGLLLELNREQDTALIVATHSRELASRLARGYELREGRLAARD